MRDKDNILSRRKFLQGMGAGCLAGAFPGALFAKAVLESPDTVAIPTTPDELYAAINRICFSLGDSNKAWEEIGGLRFMHETFAIGSTHPFKKAQRLMVRVLWNAVVSRVESLQKQGIAPVVIWRKKPQLEKVNKDLLWPPLPEGSEYMTRMRLSIGPDFSPKSYGDAAVENFGLRNDSKKFYLI